MNHRMLASVIVSTGVVLGSALLTISDEIPGRGPIAVAYGEIRLADLPFAKSPADGCGICGVCSLSEGGTGHSAQSGSGGNTEGAGWHPNCLANTCGCKHQFTCACFCEDASDPEECMENCNAVGPGCDAEEEEEESELQKLWTAVVSGQMDPRDAVAKFSNVELNRERGALQVIGCNDEVIAHIPLRGQLRP